MFICMYMCKHECGYMCFYVCSHWGLGVCLPVLKQVARSQHPNVFLNKLFILFFETVSLIETRTCCFSWIAWPWVTLLLSPALVLGTPMFMLKLWVGYRDSCSGPHACTASSLSNMSPPQSWHNYPTLSWNTNTSSSSLAVNLHPLFNKPPSLIF